MSARSPLQPFIILGVVAVVPALVLAGAWRWAANRAANAQDGYPTPVESVASQPTPSAAMSTGLLSYRRHADAISLGMNLSAFRSAVAPVINSINQNSCVAISLDGQSVGEKNLDQSVLPASNEKVPVAAVALDVLGADFTYRTVVMGTPPTGGIIDGDIVLVGGGDPLLSGDWYATSGLERMPVFNATSLDQLARDLAATGVTEIRGGVVGDASRYDDEYFAPGWGDGVGGIEAGPYDALLANDATVYQDPLRGSNPAESAARDFIRALRDAGITVTGGASAGVAPAGLSELVAIESLPLSDIVTEMLTNSDNNTAELVLKELGYQMTGQGTRQAGLDVLRSTIESWGINLEGVVFADGSGLSRDNRMTCRAMMGILSHGGLDGEVGQAMSVAGQRGWLEYAFADTPMVGRLRAKTGTLRNPPVDVDPPAVKALSGFVAVEGGPPIQFSLILNGPSVADVGEYGPIWDALATALSSYPAAVSPAQLGPR
ncbi:MAG: D-alanyl-D-alanine carboxypeptidase/D-alanyl-D-alanine-endopeptidase [Ilumatobacter coccineus]|uniref:D-alanyl-D-alanine carboxypeptidase/D-alanyl-D-alanine-endopeptidase n=1 Tax=Ilumatobacter coccineus TaxID=467094 RepID=A0A2G6KAG7_9ACTN|nr:MAG: D-alanyl-D-alanine carboxypeptidase/D-alanyl-D-alanine-endopeptidase [Ilumatobacter coccineus]